MFRAGEVAGFTNFPICQGAAGKTVDSTTVSVHFIENRIAKEAYYGLATRAGEEVVDEY